MSAKLHSSHDGADQPADRGDLLRRLTSSRIEAPPTPSTRTWLAPLLLGIVVLQAAVVAYLLLRADPASAPATVDKPARLAGTAAPETGDLSSDAKLVGQGYVIATRRATVSSRQLGIIKAIYVDEGDHVRAGQILGQLDTRDADVNLRLAESQLSILADTTRGVRAQLGQDGNDLQRRSKLSEKGFVTTADAQAARTKYDVTRADLRTALSRERNARQQIARARLQISDLTIRAPFDGVVIERNAQPGEVLAPSGAGGGFTRTGLCTIVDMTSRQIVIDVSEQMITRVKIGQPVEAQLIAYPDFRIRGQVWQITPSADRARGTVRVRIKMLTDDDRVLPDMGVKVRFL